jgi:hypothetical protein
MLWGYYQDSLNFSNNEIGDSERFFDFSFLMQNAVEGASSIVSQFNNRTPLYDFGLTAIFSGICRLLPGFILRRYDITLVPIDITDSIVISGIESYIIHFGFISLFLFPLTLLLLYKKSLNIRDPFGFISFVSLITLIRSGTYSAINNFVVISVLLIFFILLDKLLPKLES